MRSAETVAPRWHGPGDASPDRVRASWAVLVLGETESVQLGNSGKCAYLVATAAVCLILCDEPHVHVCPGGRRLAGVSNSTDFWGQLVHNRDRKSICVPDVRQKTHRRWTFLFRRAECYRAGPACLPDLSLLWMRADGRKNLFSSNEVAQGRAGWLAPTCPGEAPQVTCIPKEPLVHPRGASSRALARPFALCLPPPFGGGILPAAVTETVVPALRDFGTDP